MSSVPKNQAILLVEDNSTDARVIVKALKAAKLKGTVHHCRSGEEAVDYLMRRNGHSNAVRPDMILLDLSMPGIAGLDVLKMVKTTPDFQTIPVVMLTTSDEPSDVNACYAAGANGYIKKPVGIDCYTRMARGLADYWFQISTIPAPA